MERIGQRIASICNGRILASIVAKICTGAINVLTPPRQIRGELGQRPDTRRGTEQLGNRHAQGRQATEEAAEAEAEGGNDADEAAPREDGRPTYADEPPPPPPYTGGPRKKQDRQWRHERGKAGGRRDRTNDEASAYGRRGRQQRWLQPGSDVAPCACVKSSGGAVCGYTKGHDRTPQLGPDVAEIACVKPSVGAENSREHQLDEALQPGSDVAQCACVKPSGGVVGKHRRGHDRTLQLGSDVAEIACVKPSGGNENGREHQLDEALQPGSDVAVPACVKTSGGATHDNGRRREWPMSGARPDGGHSGESTRQARRHPGTIGHSEGPSSSEDEPPPLTDEETTETEEDDDEAREASGGLEDSAGARRGMCEQNGNCNARACTHDNCNGGGQHPMARRDRCDTAHGRGHDGTTEGSDDATTDDDCAGSNSDDLGIRRHTHKDARNRNYESRVIGTTGCGRCEHGDGDQRSRASDEYTYDGDVSVRGRNCASASRPRTGRHLDRAHQRCWERPQPSHGVHGEMADDEGEDWGRTGGRMRTQANCTHRRIGEASNPGPMAEAEAGTVT